MRDLRILGAVALAVSLTAGSTIAAEKQSAGAAAQAQKTTTVAQKTCPVMGDGPLDTTAYADHEGKRVYFCCAGCIAAFKKDPAKYLKILADRGETVRVVDSSKAATAPTASKGAPPTASASAAPGTPAQLKAQKTCPVMGGAIDKKVYADYKGQRVYFCCEGCRAPFKKDPEGYLKKILEAGEKPETL
jgi:YHS domain-containing protein